MDSLERLEIARKVRADEALRQPFLGDDRSFNAATPESTVRSQNSVGSISRSHSANEIDRKCVVPVLSRIPQVKSWSKIGNSLENISVDSWFLPYIFSATSADIFEEMNKLVTNLGQRVSSSPAVAASVPAAVTATTEANIAGVTRNSHSFSVKEAGERLLSHRTTARLDDEDRGHSRVPTDIACKSIEEEYFYDSPPQAESLSSISDTDTASNALNSSLSFAPIEIVWSARYLQYSARE